MSDSTRITKDTQEIDNVELAIAKANMAMAACTIRDARAMLQVDQDNGWFPRDEALRKLDYAASLIVNNLEFTQLFALVPTEQEPKTAKPLSKDYALRRFYGKRPR